MIKIDGYIVKTWLNYEKFFSDKFDDYREALEYFNKKVDNYKKIEVKKKNNKNVSFSISLERLKSSENKFLKQKEMLLDIDCWLNKI